jgi:hypothetical protein
MYNQELFKKSKVRKLERRVEEKVLNPKIELRYSC